MRHRHLLSILILSIVVSCNNSPETGSVTFIHESTSGINDDALVHAADDSINWITYGRNYSEDRYSPLMQINKQNVNRLGLEWSLDLGFRRGFEATPIVVNGTMYVTG
ncbi:MAG TPA: hypothetical protein VLA58_00445, partial [Chitinophagaceae bacterium]|nr:hypothetical protein [Chitinophagaceae bacterium]